MLKKAEVSPCSAFSSQPCDGYLAWSLPMCLRQVGSFGPGVIECNVEAAGTRGCVAVCSNSSQ